MPEVQKLASGFRPLVLAAALGLLHAVTFAPWGNWWAQLIVLVGFAGLTLSLIRSGRTPGFIALGGLLFGFGWFIAGVGWLFVSMHTYGQMQAPLALLALVLFAIYLALFPAAAVWATAALTRSPTSPPTRPPSQPLIRPPTRHLIQALPFALTFAATLTLGDLARGHLF
nr:hypothetical protein [Lautropia sp.]